eukprot:scaffold721_cov131-Cylindrotheca_fusiformis.AAC.70
MERSIQQNSHRQGGSGSVFLTSVLLLSLTSQVQAWGSSENTISGESLYGNTFDNDWLNSGSALSFQVEGCAWGYVEDSEESGCLEDESEEGTTNWYMMASCRRPQFVTKGGVSEFVYYLQTYDGNFGYDDDSYGFDELPNCEGGDYGYVGLACTDSGGFAINYFNDQYCVSRTGNSYDDLDSLNTAINSYKSCHKSYSNGDDQDASLIHKLVYYSEPCMSNDYPYCSDSKEYSQRATRSSFANVKTNKWSSRASFFGAHKSWVTKLKYVIGGLFLLASFIMFTGILFTNRRRRRAMMMRKYRQAKREKRSKKTGKSRSSSRRRSKSRTKDRDDKGVLT